MRPLALLTAAVAVLLIACGTVEQNAWTIGLSREDATEISRLVHAKFPDCRIVQFPDIAVTFIRNRPAVPVGINGQYVFFMLDTGFSKTTITAATQARFRLPIDPFLLLLAACALAWCAMWLRALARRRDPAPARARAAAP